MYKHELALMLILFQETNAYVTAADYAGIKLYSRK